MPINKNTFPTATMLRQIIQNDFNSPFVFKNKLRTWGLLNITEKYRDICVHFRMVSKQLKDISWENCSEYIEASISQFTAWQSTETSCLPEENPFHKFSKEDYWAYSSYNYIKDVFPQDSDILKIINWNAFGFPEISAKESTFWIGSSGAYTPCHFDSYGCNLVAQVEGRKKWILFPPEDTLFMYPTRIPYEESSVFSAVNILNPNISEHPLFKESHPHVVVLEPGDVLFVPKKWWHFVQSLDNTISINTWIKLDSDNESRLEEAVSKALMNSLISFYEPEGECWLNLKEDILESEKVFNYIISALRQVKPQNIGPCNLDSECDTLTMKSVQMDQETGVQSKHLKLSCDEILKHNDIKQVLSTPFLEYLNSVDAPKPANCLSNEITLKKVIDCFVQPDVIALICQHLKSL